MSQVVVIDYGMGNLKSVHRGLEKVGAEVLISFDPDEIATAERLVLPGVGAFAHGMAELKARGLHSFINQAAQNGLPIMGICLGMQMLAQRSFEFGETEGLGLIDGVVSLIRASNSGQLLRLPHVAWKPLAHVRDDASWLFEGVDPAARFYFIHSYAVSVDSKHVVATAQHDGTPFGAITLSGNVVGTQFHPEKSGPEGLRLLKNFVSKGE